jgi:hypothetical protein
MSKLEWSPTEVFEISGYELETMVNILSQKLQSSAAQAVIREYETLKMLQERIQKGVESGKVKVFPDDSYETDTPTMQI